MLWVQQANALSEAQQQRWQTLFSTAQLHERQAREYLLGVVHTRAENLTDAQVERARRLFGSLVRHARATLADWLSALRGAEVWFDLLENGYQQLEPTVSLGGDEVFDVADADERQQLVTQLCARLNVRVPQLRATLANLSRALDIAITCSNPSSRPTDMCNVVRCGARRWLGCMDAPDERGERAPRWFVVIRMSKGAAQTSMHLQVRTPEETAALYSLLAMAPLVLPAYAQHHFLFMNANGGKLQPQTRLEYFKRAQVQAGEVRDLGDAYSLQHLRQLSAALASGLSERAQLALNMGHSLPTARNSYTGVAGRSVQAANDEFYSLLGAGGEVNYSMPRPAVSGGDSLAVLLSAQRQNASRPGETMPSDGADVFSGGLVARRTSPASRIVYDPPADNDEQLFDDGQISASQAIGRRVTETLPRADPLLGTAAVLRSPGSVHLSPVTPTPPQRQSQSRDTTMPSMHTESFSPAPPNRPLAFTMQRSGFVPLPARRQTSMPRQATRSLMADFDYSSSGDAAEQPQNAASDGSDDSMPPAGGTRWKRRRVGGL